MASTKAPSLSNSSEEKKKRYTSLLYKSQWDSRRNTDHSPLAFLGELAPEQKVCTHCIVLYASLLGGLGSVTSLYWFVLHGSRLQQSLSILSTVLFVTFSILTIIARDKRDAEMRILLEDALGEFQYELDELKKYITEFDNKSNRIFHAITHSKTSAYYLLNQALTNMIVLEESAREALDQNSRRGLLKARSVLQGTVTFADGVILSGGEMHTIPLAQVTVALKRLMKQLDSDLEEFLREG